MATEEHTGPASDEQAKCDGRGVPSALILDICSFIIHNLRDGEGNPDHSSLEGVLIKRRAPDVRHFVHGIQAKIDPTQGRLASIVMDAEGLSPNRLKLSGGAVKECFKVASRALASTEGMKGLFPGPDCYVYAHYCAGDRTLTLKWEENCGPDSEPKDGAKATWRASRIVVAGLAWDTEFSNQFMRGAAEMAGALGVDIEDKRLPLPCGEGLAGSSGTLLKWAEGLALDAQRDAILTYFVYPEPLRYDISELKQRGYHVVMTGYILGDICQDDILLGQRLADRCIEDEVAERAQSRRRHGKRHVLILKFSTQQDSSEYEQRIHSLAGRLEQSGLFDIERVCLDVPPPYYSAAAEAVAKVKARIDELGQASVAAVFPRAERVTPAMAEFVASLPDCAPKPRVYGERILDSDLAIMRRQEGRLMAICGADPFHVGRYAARAASCRWTGELPKVAPVLISKRAVLDTGINSTATIKSPYPQNSGGVDVRLDGPGYAWAEWMKPRKPRS